MELNRKKGFCLFTFIDYCLLYLIRKLEISRCAYKEKKKLHKLVPNLTHSDLNRGVLAVT